MDFVVWVLVCIAAICVIGAIVSALNGGARGENAVTNNGQGWNGLEQSAIEISSQFLNGEIRHHSLSPYGISRMGVVWNGVNVGISWYPSGNLRDFTIDGASYPEGGDAKNARHVLNAARNRAGRILDEKLKALNSKTGKEAKGE